MREAEHEPGERELVARHPTRENHAPSGDRGSPAPTIDSSFGCPKVQDWIRASSGYRRGVGPPATAILLSDGFRSGIVLEAASTLSRDRREDRRACGTYLPAPL